MQSNSTATFAIQVTVSSSTAQELGEARAQQTLGTARGASDLPCVEAGELDGVVAVEGRQPQDQSHLALFALAERVGEQDPVHRGLAPRLIHGGVRGSRAPAR